MKKLVLLALISAVTFVNAQFTKGTKVLEVNTSSNELRISPTGFMFYLSEGGETAFAAGISGGYFIADGIAIKGGFGYSTSHKGGEMINQSFGVNGGIAVYPIKQVPVELLYSGSFRKWYENAHYLTLKTGYSFVFNQKFVLTPYVMGEKSLTNVYKDGLGVGVSFAYHFGGK